MSTSGLGKRRAPQQERGERRVVELLQAAADVMAEVGYEAATMTAIAEQAGSSIGTLYQYFPNKEALVQALRLQYVSEVEERWKPLTAQASRQSVKHLVDRIIDMIIDYIEKRPAFITLLGAPESYKRSPAVRNRLRQHFATLFREKCPELTPEAAFRISNVTMQIVKSMNPLYVAASGAEKDAIVQEFKHVLMSYLSSRLKSG